MRIGIAILGVLLLFVSLLGCSDSYKTETFKVSPLSEKAITVHCNAGDIIEGSIAATDVKFYIEGVGRTIYNAGMITGSHNFRVMCDQSGFYILHIDNKHSLIIERTATIRWRVK